MIEDIETSVLRLHKFLVSTDHAARAHTHTRTLDESMHVRARVGGQRRVGVENVRQRPPATASEFRMKIGRRPRSIRESSRYVSSVAGREDQSFVSELLLEETTEGGRDCGSRIR